jgi:hypothetical protein
MRCARALPVLQLMPAAGSRSVLSPPRCWVDFPERMSGRTPFGSPHVGHPINHHVTGPRPWTQIRLGAGTHNTSPHASLTGGSR